MKPFPISFLFFFCSFVFFLPAKLAAQMTVDPFVSNVFKVTDITNCGDDRLFIAEQAGKIRIADLKGNLNPIPFLSITARVNDTGGEQGLLGLAFSPGYINDRRFYVNYINNAGNTVISRFTATVSDPDIADSLDEEILFTVVQPFTNHNGGAMHFGPDGYLYISLGDGGAGGDPFNNAQNLQSRLGKLLRIDVNVSSGYRIPSSNPFIATAGADSMIWAYGLRNAWRFSFDKYTGDNWIADVGQNLWEEINVQPATSPGGENYGWRCYEGVVAYDLTGCQPQSAYINPVHTYPHFPACSVTGGYVYRGARHSIWFGKYFFTDYCSGVMQSLAPNDTGGYDLENYGSFGSYAFTTFGQDRYGELYVGKVTSGVFKLNDAGCLPVAFITKADTIRHTGASLLLKTPYSPDLTYQWYFNDDVLPGATNYKYRAQVSGNYSVKVTDDSLCTNMSKSVLVFLTSENSLLVYPNPADAYTEQQHRMKMLSVIIWTLTNMQKAFISSG
jgi:glucose/arabinose dehydrogenase